MSEFEQLPLENPASWLSRLIKIEQALLPLEQRRVHAYYLADARRLLQEEQQKAKWKQGI